MRPAPSPVSMLLDARQILVNERDCHASLADGGRHSLHWAQSYIAARKNARDTCLKKIRIATLRPATGLPQIIACQNISSSVAGDIRWQPFGLCVGSNEDEQAAGIVPSDLPARAVANV